MRKSKKFKKEKEEFKGNLLVTKRLISIYTSKAILVILLSKIKIVQKFIEEIEEINHLVELISQDLINNKEAFDSLVSIISINDNKIQWNAEEIEQFNAKLYELIDDEYLTKVLMNYNRKMHKIQNFIQGSEIIATNASKCEYEAILK